jgi:integrase
MASKMKATASLIFKFAIANDLVNQNYAEYIVLPKQEEQEREHFSIEEIQKILLAVDKVPYADYIAVLILTGMRPNEMFWLKKSDYHGTYFIGGSKTDAGKNRLIPIPTIIQPMVKSVAERHIDFIFCAPNGKKMDLTNFRKRCYYPALEQIGVRALPPYSCRHTFATLLKNSDAPITDKQKLMGHSSFSMTAHYTHTDIESLAKASDSAVTALQHNTQKNQ